jgi:hypothetical protein
MEEPEPAIAFNRFHPPNNGEDRGRHEVEIFTVKIIKQSAANVTDVTGELIKITNAVATLERIVGFSSEKQ